VAGIQGERPRIGRSRLLNPPIRHIRLQAFEDLKNGILRLETLPRSRRHARQFETVPHHRPTGSVDRAHPAEYRPRLLTDDAALAGPYACKGYQGLAGRWPGHWGRSPLRDGRRPNRGESRVSRAGPIDNESEKYHTARRTTSYFVPLSIHSISILNQSAEFRWSPCFRDHPRRQQG
jgi:hypothetical protein